MNVETQYWTMEQVNALLAELASYGWDLRATWYGLNDETKVACEVTVTRRRNGPTSIAAVNELNDIILRHGAELELSLCYSSEEGGGAVARVGLGRWGERFIIDTPTRT